MPINNESIGIAAEVAIAETFNVYINPRYAMRAEPDVVRHLLSGPYILDIFRTEDIPVPVEHIAEGQNPVDFILAGGRTMSVKTNQNAIGRAAPQRIGQPTQYTYFEFLEANNILPGFSVNDFLFANHMCDTYENRAQIFKFLSINYIDTLINMYWENMFECDYLLLFFNLETYQNPLYNYKVFGKMASLPRWNPDCFSFTQSLDTWNESNTLKYCGISIGNFQVHRNRDCFKFRFNMNGVMRLINERLI